MRTYMHTIPIPKQKKNKKHSELRQMDAPLRYSKNKSKKPNRTNNKYAKIVHITHNTCRTRKHIIHCRIRLELLNYVICKSMNSIWMILFDSIPGMNVCRQKVSPKNVPYAWKRWGI